MTLRNLYCRSNWIFKRNRWEERTKPGEMFYRTVEEMSCAQKEIISEVIKLIKLIVLIPVTNASSENQNQWPVASKPI